MKRLIVRPRRLLLVAVLALVAALCTGYPAHAASPASAGQASSVASRDAAPSSSPCTFQPATTCQSTDHTVALNIYYYGSQSGCTYAWDVDWGDGNSQSFTVTDPAEGYIFLTNHTYTTPGKYTIAVTGQVTAGDCVVNPFTVSFTLLQSTSPPVFNKFYSGYLTPFAAKYHEVGGTWHIPTLDCADSALISGASQWIGLGGVTIGKQVSTPLVQVGVISGCVAGLQVNVPFWEVVPGNNAQLMAHLPSPGDEIAAVVDYLGNGKYLVGIKDSTAGWTDGGRVPFTVSGKVPTSAEWIIEPGDLVNGKSSTAASLADFGSVTFAGASYSTSHGITLGGPGSVTPIVLEQTTGGSPQGTQWTTVSTISPPGEFTITYIPN